MWPCSKLNRKEMGILGSFNVLVVILLVLYSRFYNIRAFNHVECRECLKRRPGLQHCGKGIELVDSMGVGCRRSRKYFLLQEEMDRADDVTQIQLKFYMFPISIIILLLWTLLRAFLKNFQVDVIIDTGDLSITAQYLKRNFLRFFAELKLPMFLFLEIMIHLRLLPI